MNCDNSIPSLNDCATDNIESILDQKLAFVVAFGLDGKIKFIFRNGIELNPKDFQIPDPLDLIDIQFKLPRNEYIDCCNCTATEKVLRLYRLCPQPGGGIGPCPGPCPSS